MTTRNELWYRVIGAVLKYGEARGNARGDEWLSPDNEATQALRSILDDLNEFERVCVDTYREVGT